VLANGINSLFLIYLSKEYGILTQKYFGGAFAASFFKASNRFIASLSSILINFI
jgi:hypothetical protein